MAKESSGGGAYGRTTMVIRKGHREVVGVGRCDDQAAHLSNCGIWYSATTADNNNNDRGGTALLTPSSTGPSHETTTTTTAMTMMMTTTASPATIESMGAAVLVPHLAHCGFNIIIFTKLSYAVRKHTDARALEHY